jgi:hypothetical protein
MLWRGTLSAAARWFHEEPSMIKSLSPAARQLLEQEVEVFLGRLGSARDDPDSLEQFARTLEHGHSSLGDRRKLWALFIRRRALHLRTCELEDARQ